MGSLLNFASHHQCVMAHRGWADENVRVGRAKWQPTYQFVEKFCWHTGI